VPTIFINNLQRFDCFLQTEIQPEILNERSQERADNRLDGTSAGLVFGVHGRQQQKEGAEFIPSGRLHQNSVLLKEQTKL
jgi:hypothetical protein